MLFDQYFPKHKPEYFLDPPDALDFIPHVYEKGFICYIDDEGILIDQVDVEQIIIQSFQKMCKTLEDGLSGKNKQDFLEDFQVYWLKNDFLEERTCESICALDNNLREIPFQSFAGYDKDVIGDSEEEIENFFSIYLGSQIVKHKSTYTEQNLVLPGKSRTALYIPLKNNHDVFPPHYSSFWSLEELKQIINRNIIEEGDNKKKLETLLKRPFSAPGYLILSIPISEDKKAIIGIKIYNTSFDNQKHPLTLTGKKCKITPFHIIRMDREYIAPRGGAATTLGKKHILLLGCGSLGGYIAEELTKVGIKKLSLVDSDTINIENIYRHTLGLNNLKTKQVVAANKKIPKSFALSNYIKLKIPYVDIQPFNEKIENLIHKDISFFQNYDLVISALGNPTIELYLNKIFQQNTSMPPLLFTWLEPYGIGGHAFLTNNNNSGCFDCLYRLEEGEFEGKEYTILYNQSSFAAPHQYFSKQLGGCYSLFTPFSSIDSIQTSILAVRLALNYLEGRERDNPLISWKGDSRIFVEEGYKLSPRYKFSSDDLFNHRYQYKLKECPVCSTRSQ